MIPETLKPLAVPIDSLQPYERNPRNGDLEAIKESLESNTQYRPIVVNARDNRILAGNHTYFAAMELGWKEMAATFVDADEEQAARIVLVDNRTNDLAQNDDALIAEILEELPSLEGTGYTDEALEELLAGIEKRERQGLVDPDAVPETPEDPVTKRGDVWLLGRHRVMCGDAASVDDVERLMADDPASMIFTDPPYGINWQSGKRTATPKFAVLDGDNSIGLDWLAIAFSVLREGGACYVCTRWDVYPIWAEALSNVFTLKNVVVWAKEGGGIGDLSGNYWNEHEFIMYAAKGRHELRGKRQGNVWRVDSDPPLSYVHPTQKPVQLILRAVEKSSDQGDILLDLFGGSGSTLIAAEKTDRQCYMMELSETYTDVIAKRFQEYTGTLPILESTGEEHDFASETNTI